MMRATLALLCLAAPLATQTPERPPAPALHRGWLVEMLDSDRQHAAVLYEEAASDPGMPKELRAVALARLVELERLDEDPDQLETLVRRLREVIDELDMPQPSGFRFGGQPVPSAGLAEAVRAGGDELDAWFESQERRRGLRSFDTRPLVSSVYEDLVAEVARARTAGNDAAARRFVRQLTQGSSRSRFVQRRGRIVQILKLTLDGNMESAARLRRSLRPDLQRPAPMPDDPSQALTRARTRLDGELARIGLNPDERRALRQLQTRLGELAPDRATEAVELLRGLPVYGELLLGNR